MRPSAAGVLVTRKFPGYKDIPGVCYHYPVSEYGATMNRLIGCPVLYYEPRRGGTSPTSMSGGRSAFIGFGYVDRVTVDPDEPSHAFAWLRYSLNFTQPVHIKRTTISGQALQTAVLEVDIKQAIAIVQEGLTLPKEVAPQGSVRFGLADVSELESITPRPIFEVVKDVRVRDAAFRYQVVEVAYQGRCAFSGLRQTNGNGRAEADAAHIRSVAADGPDVVRNGIAISKTLHWAFDRGLIGLADDGEILTVERGLDAKLLALLSSDRRAILPKQEDRRPRTAFLKWHRENVFKGAA